LMTIQSYRRCSAVCGVNGVVHGLAGKLSIQIQIQMPAGMSWFQVCGVWRAWRSWPTRVFR
jgi:hypothetical protein